MQTYLPGQQDSLSTAICGGVFIFPCFFTLSLEAFETSVWMLLFHDWSMLIHIFKYEVEVRLLSTHVGLHLRNILFVEHDIYIKLYR